MSMIERSWSRSLIRPSLGVVMMSPTQTSLPGMAGRRSKDAFRLSWRIMTFPDTLTILPAGLRAASAAEARPGPIHAARPRRIVGMTDLPHMVFSLRQGAARAKLSTL